MNALRRRPVPSHLASPVSQSGQSNFAEQSRKHTQNAWVVLIWILLDGTRSGESVRERYSILYVSKLMVQTSKKLEDTAEVVSIVSKALSDSWVVKMWKPGKPEISSALTTDCPRRATASLRMELEIISPIIRALNSSRWTGLSSPNGFCRVSGRKVCVRTHWEWPIACTCK